jgi:hypothetical protein
MEQGIVDRTARADLSKVLLHTPEFTPDAAKTRGADRDIIAALFDIVNAASQAAREVTRPSCGSATQTGLLLCNADPAQTESKSPANSA